MSNREKAELYRNASKRTELGFVNPVGEVSEDELRNLAGAADVTPPLLPHCLAEYLSQQLFVLLPNVHQAANLTNDKYGEDW
ncbi:class II lanthipeptide, LchA2/BrtA2 family [Bacillus subtilis]|uniref:Class II lanthipeptide, LchA2/BrtA2 family n=1 Tax=Bacillus subtilis TaxID=1423 RepID=A0AAX3RPQ5_BACIU|nr:class II lanthipeptide, LchA2/BrtA2 family [Bacillus subtilis]